MTDLPTVNTADSKDYGAVLHAWRFHEFERHERSRQWYIWGGVAVATLLVYSVISRNLLFGFIVVLAAVIVLMRPRANREVQFSITEDGIVVHEKFYPFEQFKNFFIIYQPPATKTLYFEPKGLVMPRFPIPLEDQNPVKIRETLLKYLSEDLEREHEPLSDQFSRFFKL